MELRNAIIEGISLGMDDHNILTAWLSLNYGNSCQGFGGYVLYLPKGWRHHSAWGLVGHFIYRCLEIAGVDKWDDLEGRTIRVKHDKSKVYAIGHILKDDWFCPEEDFKNLDGVKEK